MREYVRAAYDENDRDGKTEIFMSIAFITIQSLKEEHA